MNQNKVVAGSKVEVTSIKFYLNGRVTVVEEIFKTQIIEGSESVAYRLYLIASVKYIILQVELLAGTYRTALFIQYFSNF